MLAPILVVDDSDSVRITVKFILSHAGYTVLVAKGGGEALEIARREAVAGALVDIYMPGMDGFEACARLRAECRQRGQDLPVWMISASPTTDNHRRALEAGALALFAKPFDQPAVLSALEQKLHLASQTSATQAAPQ